MKIMINMYNKYNNKTPKIKLLKLKFKYLKIYKFF